MSRGSLLLVTLPPFRGGVPAKAAIMARHLRRLGWAVTVAYYATLSDHPDLVAPSWRLPGGALPGSREGQCWDGFAAHAVGCRFPELEAPYTRASAPWRALVASHDRHMAIGGTALVEISWWSAVSPICCGAPARWMTTAGTGSRPWDGSGVWWIGR